MPSPTRPFDWKLEAKAGEGEKLETGNWKQKTVSGRWKEMLKWQVLGAEIRRWVRTHPWWSALLLVGLVLHGGTALLRLERFWPYPKQVDFAGFYAAAWAWRSGLPSYGPPEAWLKALMDAQNIPFLPPPIYNPPVMVFLILPFTLVPFPLAAWLWTGLNVGLALLDAVWLSELAGLKQRWQTLLVALLVLSFGPLVLDVSLGQVSVLLLTLALIWLRHVDGPRRRWGAAAVALAGGIKVFPLYWMGVYLFKRAWWKTAIAAIGVTLCLGALSLSLAPQASADYVSGQFSGRLSASAQMPGVDDQSLLAWMLRLTQPQQVTLHGLVADDQVTVTWMPRVTMPQGVVTISAGLILAIISLMTGFAIWRNTDTKRVGAWSLWLLLGLLALPHMERYNHVLILPALAWLWGNAPRWRGWVLAVYVMEGLARLTHTFASALPFPWAAWMSGWGLYAALITWGLLIHRLQETA